MDIYNEELRKMFIELSTNRDLRKIIEFYNKNGLDDSNIVDNFYEIMKTLDTEEIADRITIDLFINFEGIKISNQDLDIVLCDNKNIKDVQVEYIAQRSSIDTNSLNNLIQGGQITSNTLNLLIHNSSCEDLYKIEFEKTKYLLDKESALKLMRMADNYHKDFYVWVASNEKGLTAKEIDDILKAMDEGGMQMENVVGEGLLGQVNLTNKQLEQIAFWDEYPTPMIFEICHSRHCYNDEEIFEFYKCDPEGLLQVILNSGNAPVNLLNHLFVYGNDVDRKSLFVYSAGDDEYQQNLLLLEKEEITSDEEEKLIELLKKDARYYFSVAMCENKNILTAAYNNIDNFYDKTEIEHVYSSRVDIIRALVRNECIGNDMVIRIINENKDAFSDDEFQELQDEALMNMTQEEEQRINDYFDEINESFDDYLLATREDVYDKYNEQYYEDLDRHEKYDEGR